MLRLARNLSKWLALVMLTLPWGWAVPSHAEPPKSIYEAVNVKELRRLLDVARESGFSEEEVRKITVEYLGEVINVWEFLATLEKQQADKLASDKAMREKPYHTVQDVFADLEQGQSDDLKKLRKDFRFNQ